MTDEPTDEPSLDWADHVTRVIGLTVTLQSSKVDWAVVTSGWARSLDGPYAAAVNGSRWRPTWWDVAVCGAIAASVAASGAADLSTPRPTAVVTVFGLLSAVALLARTRRPVDTLVVVTVLGLAPTLVAGTYPDFYSSFVPALAAVYAVAVRGTTRQAALVPVTGVIELVCFAARVPSFMTPAQFIFITVGLTLAFAAGRTMRALRQRVDLESARADLLEREQNLLAREAVVAERERIARELHDVIAHDVSVMVVHAGAAQRLLPDRAGPAAQSLSQIQTSGRKAIDELHLLLGMLREDHHGLLTQPGLHAVTELIDELVRVGLPVSLEVSGSVRDVGEALDVSAYRLVQEALTNVLKHAPGSRTFVAVDYGRTTLTLTVVDDGSGDGPTPDLASSGHGLVGMRERVRMFGARSAVARNRRAVGP